MKDQEIRRDFSCLVRLRGGGSRGEDMERDIETEREERERREERKRGKEKREARGRTCGANILTRREIQKLYSTHCQL